MKVLSFDIGITNLGYSILNSDDNGTVTVDALGVINILESEKRQCSGHTKKTGEQCKSKAKVLVAERLTDDWMHYCKTHASKDKKKYKQKVWKPKNAKNISIQDMSVAVIQSLSNYNFEEYVDVVLVENQPGRATQRIKAVQFVLYTYYVLKGVLVSESPVKEVKLTSPRKKLRIYTGPNFQWVTTKESLGSSDLCLLEPSVKNRKSREYRKRKMLGMAHAERILQTSDNCVLPIVCAPELFEEYSKLLKKDDACDAFLQGLSHFV